MQQSIVIDDDDGQEPETSASSPSSPTAPESPQAPNNSSAAKVSAKEYYETFFVNPVCKTECAKGQARSWKKYSATCKLCAESDAKRLVNGGADSFDAFKKHVTRHHSKTKDYTEFIAKKVKDNEISQTKLSKEQPTLTEFVIQKVEPYGKNHWKQVRLNDAVGNIMLKTLAPPSMLGDLSFDEAIKIGDSKLKWPRRHQLTRHILPKFEKEIRGKIQILLSTATAVSLNVDLWTSKRCHGYMGVTVSFIDEKFCLRNFVLGCPRFKESHTAENIFQLATVLILDYNLKDVLHYVGLDNGRNFVNAFDDWMPSLFPAEFLRKPDAEDEHVVDEDGLNDCVESVENDDERAEESDLDFDSQRTEQAFQKIRDTYCRIPDRNIVVRCAAHTLSLAIGSAMADAQVINQVIDGLAGIVNRVKHSHSETTILEEAFKKTFVSRNQTRWNSNFLMAKRAAEFDWERCGLSQKNILKPAHRLVLQAFVNLMEVFNASFKILQTADYPVIGDVIPILCGLRRHIKTCQKNIDFVLLQDFMKGLLKQLDERFGAVEKDNLYLAAAFLDPKYKLLWCNSFGPEKSAEMVLKIKALMLGMMQEVGCGQDVQFKESKNSFVGPDFLNFLYRGQSSLSGRLSMRQDSGSDKAATCETELEMYIASSWIGTNPLEFWKSAEAACLPRLKILAKQVLCAPATTADVERMFSVAGILLSNRRLKTSDEHFERLLFCSINKRRLDGDLNVGGKRKLNS